MTKLDRARGTPHHRRVWRELLGNVMRSWSPSFVDSAARRRVP